MFLYPESIVNEEVHTETLKKLSLFHTTRANATVFIRITHAALGTALALGIILFIHAFKFALGDLLRVLGK